MRQFCYSFATVMRQFCYGYATVLYWRWLPKKLHFIGEPKFSDIDFTRIQLLQHSVREYLVCNNGNKTKWLAPLKLLLKPSGGCYAWYCALTCVEFEPQQQHTERTPLNATVSLDERLQHLHLNCQMRAPDISCTIIILTFSVLSNFSYRSFIVSLFGPFVTLNFIWKLCLL